MRSYGPCKLTPDTSDGEPDVVNPAVQPQYVLEVNCAFDAGAVTCVPGIGLGTVPLIIQY